VLIASGALVPAIGRPLPLAGALFIAGVLRGALAVSLDPASDLLGAGELGAARVLVASGASLALSPRILVAHGRVSARTFRRGLRVYSRATHGIPPPPTAAGHSALAIIAARRIICHARVVRAPLVVSPILFLRHIELLLRIPVP
jgi:hypothetical protein